MKIILTAGGLLFAGMIYGIFCIVTNIRIPCIFYKITGFMCPGCGITRMCISLMQLDFVSAWHYNQAMMIFLPVLVVIGIQIALKYIDTGKITVTKVQNKVLWLMAVVLILFGVLRNIIN